MVSYAQGKEFVVLIGIWSFNAPNSVNEETKVIYRWLSGRERGEKRRRRQSGNSSVSFGQTRRLTGWIGLVNYASQ